MVSLMNNTSYTFNGVYASLENDDFFDLFLDTLETSFDNFTSSDTKYRTMLPMKIYGGAAIYPANWVSVGLLTRLDFFKGNMRQQYSFTANLYPINMFSASFSYSIIDGGYKNLGLGLSLKLLPLNLYIITDTGPSAFLWQADARMLNFKIGMNIMIGRPDRLKKEKSKVYDVPLVD
jgi:hypothetical protein